MTKLEIIILGIITCFTTISAISIQNCCHQRTTRNSVTNSVHCSWIKDVEECAKKYASDCLWYCDINHKYLLDGEWILETNFIGINDEQITSPVSLNESTITKDETFLYHIDKEGVIYQLKTNFTALQQQYSHSNYNNRHLLQAKLPKNNDIRLAPFTSTGMFYRKQPRYTTDVPYCTGTVIQSYKKPYQLNRNKHYVYVLLAAHCVVDKKNSRTLGKIYFYKKKEMRFYLNWNKNSLPDWKKDKTPYKVVDDILISPGYQKVVGSGYQDIRAREDWAVLRFVGSPVKHKLDISYNDKFTKDRKNGVMMKMATYDARYEATNGKIRWMEFDMYCKGSNCWRGKKCKDPPKFKGRRTNCEWVEGMSGSSILYNDGSNFDGKIAAVLSGGVGSATRITKEAFYVICDYTRKEVNDRLYQGWSSAQRVDYGDEDDLVQTIEYLKDEMGKEMKTMHRLEKRAHKSGK